MPMVRYQCRQASLTSCYETTYSLYNYTNTFTKLTIAIFTCIICITFNPMLLGHIVQLVFCMLGFMLIFVCARVCVRVLVRACACVHVRFYVDVYSCAVARGYATSVVLSWFNAFFREVLLRSYLA